jgi:hypothetical protein
VAQPDPHGPRECHSVRKPLGVSFASVTFCGRKVEGVGFGSSAGRFIRGLAGGDPALVQGGWQAAVLEGRNAMSEARKNRESGGPTQSRPKRPLWL